MPKFRWFQYFCLVLLALTFLFVPASSAVSHIDLAFPSKATQPPALPPLIDQVTIPIFTGDELSEVPLSTISAQAVYVMDRDSGAILYTKNAETAKYPASTAKMMTALVVRQNYQLNDLITVKEEAFSTGSSGGLVVGEQLTVEQLLAALLIPSGNDAALVLANHHPLGYSGFVTAMNQRAQELHLTHTTFRNPSGLDVQTQTSTARDLAIIAQEVMKDPVLRNIVKQKELTIQDQTGRFTHKLINTDELIGTEEGVIGIKTGTTDFAGENLVTAVSRNGHEAILVMLSSQNRFPEAKQLIEWVFDHYHWQEIDRKNQRQK